MQTIYRLPETLKADLVEFKEQTQRFKSGAISEVEYRAFRVPHGVYEQREKGTYMIRVRLPAGGVLPHQMRTLASISKQYGSGILHLTTRQTVQIHGVALDDVHPALLTLYRAELSARGGGGNTVRNITACPDAGVSPDEVFDVSPYAVALTEFLLRDPASYRLPRKYKIAFSCSSKDCAGAAVSDLGFIAKEGSSGRGFSVYVGGGLGSCSRVAQLLESFVPADQVHLIAEAVKRVFNQHGNRENRHKARLRYLIKDKGFERFKVLYREELEKLYREGLPALEVRDLPQRHAPKATVSSSKPIEGFHSWKEQSVRSQKQTGFFWAELSVVLGEIQADQFSGLADVTEEFGDGVIRVTPSQNLVIRWIQEAELPALHRRLTALHLADVSSPLLRQMSVCKGAATCRLGICLSQGLGSAIRSALERTSLDLQDACGLKLHINGCPNACGRHPVASIGLVGGARRFGDRFVPCYTVKLGGRLGQGQTKLAEGSDILPARYVPIFLVALLRAFRGSAQYPDFDAYLAAGGRQTAAKLAARHQRVAPFEQDRSSYTDWGAEEPFALAALGSEESSANALDRARTGSA